MTTLPLCQYNLFVWHMQSHIHIATLHNFCDKMLPQIIRQLFCLFKRPSSSPYVACGDCHDDNDHDEVYVWECHMGTLLLHLVFPMVYNMGQEQHEHKNIMLDF